MHLPRAAGSPIASATFHRLRIVLTQAGAESDGVMAPVQNKGNIRKYDQACVINIKSCENLQMVGGNKASEHLGHEGLYSGKLPPTHLLGKFREVSTRPRNRKPARMAIQLEERQVQAQPERDTTVCLIRKPMCVACVHMIKSQ